LTTARGGPTTADVPSDLAALLVADGLVTAPDLEQARARQAEAGGALDTALLELGLVEEGLLFGALARATDLPAAPPSAWEAADARARRVFPSRVAERHGLAPFALDGRELSLVATYPVDVGLLDEISFMLSLHLTAHVGPEWRVRSLIHRLYGGALDPRFAALAQAAGGEAPDPAPGPAEAALAAAEGAFFGPPAGAEPEPAAGAAPPTELALEPPEPPAARPPLTGFSRDESEPLEPLAAALAQALESEDFPWIDATAEEFPEVEPSAPPAAEAAPPAPPPASAAPARWTLQDARAALAGAGNRDDLLRVALRYARDFFEFAAVFAVTRDAVAGHDALGPSDEARDLCRGTAIYTSDPGIFRTVIETRAPYLGPVAPGRSGNEAILSGLGRGTPRTVLVCPVVLRDRTACVLYCDNGEAPVSAGRLGDLLLFVTALGPALERLIVARKGQQAPRPPKEPRPARGPEAPTELNLPAAVPDDAGWSAREPARGHLTDLDIEVVDAGTEADGPPTTVEGEVARLVGSAPGSPRRAQSVARLAAQGDAAVQALVAALPGPLEDERAHEPARLGPVPAALSLHGAAAVPLLLSVLREAEPARRRAAVVLLGAAAEPAAFGALADRTLDADPRVAAAAAEALARNRHHPAMRGVPDRLRRSLLSGVTSRAVGAARALGALRDVEAIPLLVQLLETTAGPAAEAGAEALARITLQRHGTDARGWLAWWKEHRVRGRADWLFTALTSPDREARAAAAAELSEAAPSPVEYSPDAAPAERAAAARAWAGWWTRSGRVL
jgi:hypothetical protein